MKVQDLHSAYCDTSQQEGRHILLAARWQKLKLFRSFPRVSDWHREVIFLCLPFPDHDHRVKWLRFSLFEPIELTGVSESKGCPSYPTPEFCVFYVWYPEYFVAFGGNIGAGTSAWASQKGMSIIVTLLILGKFLYHSCDSSISSRKCQPHRVIHKNK